MMADRSLMIIGLLGLVLFVAAMLMTLAAGIGPAAALVWNILASLNIIYFTLPVSIADSTMLLAADLTDVFVFALIAVWLATVFFRAIKRVNFHDKRVRGRIAKLEGHIIVAPFNGFAQTLIAGMQGSGMKFAVIAKSLTEASKLQAQGVLAISGNPSSVEAMESAGAAKAKYVVACSEDDIENTLISISAKAASSSVKVISRLAKQENMPKLSRAGTYKIVMPEAAAGKTLAGAILKSIV